jgi:hypothetical protein
MSSKIFQNLLARLNSVFEKSPQSLAAFQIIPPADAQLVIQDRLITITAINNSSPLFSISFDNPYDSSKSITIRDLYDALSAVKSITVQNLNVALSGLGVSSLVEGSYSISSDQPNNVMAATSMLWTILRPLAYLLEQTKQDMTTAVQQLGFVTAQGDFLDYWGTIFNISRYPDEPDYEYSTRLLWETVRPRLNNKAIENIIQFGVGYQTKVVDLSPKMMLSDGFTNPTHIDITKIDEDPLQVSDSTLGNTSAGSADDTARYSLGNPYTLGAFGVYVDVPISTPYYPYSTSQISDIVERHRAAGTTPFYAVTQVANEILSLISSVIVQLDQSITQELAEDRAMFFGHDDQSFYSDHWQSSNVAKMPWYQNNLDIPSLSDGTVLATTQVTVPPPLSTTVNSYLLNAGLADGFAGGFNANMVRADGAGTADQYAGLIHNTIQFPTGSATVKYTYSPVLLSYKRYSDEALTPRIVETLSDDVFTVTTNNISGTIAAWQGIGSFANVAGSDDVTITTPIRVVGPTSISGVKFDAVVLAQQNTHNVPVVARNLEIPNFGQGWETGYPMSRVFLVPYQDTCGNRYYQEISWPVNQPPPAVALQIANPTAVISADHVQVASGGSATINWTVTNSAAADVDVQLINADGTNSTFTDTPATFSGGLTFNNITKSGTYTIVATGNNAQIASASITITVVAVPLVASAPTITASAFPDKVTLCDAKSSVISYSVVFNSKQTENQTIPWPGQSTSFNLNPIGTDPVGTIVINSRVPTVSRTSDGLVIQGGWTGFNTTTATFTPLDVNQVVGRSLIYNYDVNYAGSTLAFNNTPIALPNMGEIYQIAQQATVNLPGPSLITTAATAVKNLLPTTDLTKCRLTGGPPTTTVVAGFSDPFGGLNAYQVNFVAKAINSTDGIDILVQLDPTGLQFTGSMYMRVDSGNPTVESLVEDAPFTSNWASVQASVTTTWQRFSFTGTASANKYYSKGTRMWIRSPFAPAASAFTIYVYGMQLELAASPSSFQPTPVVGPTSSLQTSYSVPYKVFASNYAAASSVSVPVYVSSIQQSAGNFAITSVNPISVVEAIGNTMNETVPVTLAGVGFSSNMQVFLLKALPNTIDNTNTYQYVEAHITSIDWKGSGPTNLLLYTEQFDNPAWIKGNVTVNADVAQDPLGGFTADAIVYTTSGTGATLQQLVSSPGVPVANQPFTWSIWLRSPSGTQSINVLLEDQVNTVLVNVTKTVTTSWQRFSVTGTGINTSTGLRAYVYNPPAPTTIWAWGAQLETGNSATTYVSTVGALVTVSPSLTFIAPRFEMGVYPILVNKLDCLGNVLSADSSHVLVYNESTFRHPPFITDINPKTVCVAGGFTSAKVTLMGYNFRSGAQAYVLVGTTPHAVTTTFVNDTSVVINMDVSTSGSYDILVVNSDTSSGATNNQPLKVMPSATLPSVDQYGYTAPTGPGGCTTYGAEFVFYWSCSSTSYVTFTSSDPKVQTAFASPDVNGWSAVGSVTTQIFSQNTTVTLHARNECGNTTTQTLTITNVSCDVVTGINISPNPIVITARQPVAPSTFATHRTVTGIGTFTSAQVDVTADSAHSYVLAGDDNLTALAVQTGFSTPNGTVTATNAVVTLNNKILMPVRNGMINLQAFWNGFVAETGVYVQLPVPIALTVSPETIKYTAINENIQLGVEATYSDGSVVTVTSLCTYMDYDPAVISVSSSGVITTVSNGSTNIRVSFVDTTVDSTVYVYATVAVGPVDTCIAFSRLWTEPAYSLAAAPTTNVRFAVSGPNAATYNVMSDNQGNAVLNYTGNIAGTDIIQAFLDEFGVSSNKAEVAWEQLNNIIGHTPVTAQFFFSDGSGVFNTLPGTIPAFTQTLSSLIYNISGPGYGMPLYLNGDRSRPMFAIIMDQNGNSQGTQLIGGNGYSAGVSPLNHFNAVFTGNFVVKQACTIDFGVWGDDGYVFGIGGGATRVSGNFTNAPGAMPFTGVPVMGARNIDGQSGFDDIIVSFPAAGSYPFEINYSEGGGDHYVFICFACQAGNGVPQPIPFVSVGLPTALPQSSLTTPVGIQISPIVAGPNFVGTQQTISGKIIGLNRSPVTLHVNASHVRTASVNGVAVLNQGCID